MKISLVAWLVGFNVAWAQENESSKSEVQNKRGDSEATLIQEEPELKPLDLGSILHRLANEMPQKLDTKLPENFGRSKQEVLIIQKRRQAYASLNNGDLLEAIASFHEVLKLTPDDKNTQFGLGTAYIQNNEYGEALKLFEHMIARYPADYFIKNNLAWMLATAGDVKFRDGFRAVELAQEALLVAPGDYHVWSTLAESYYVSGEYEKGLRAAKEALFLGKNAKLSDEKLLVYQEQIDRCSRAALAMSILE